MSDSKKKKYDDPEKGISHEAVCGYATRCNINLQESYNRLQEKYKQEVESVDAKEVALKCIKAIRMVAPKVNGLEIRENEYRLMINKMNSRLDNIETKINELKPPKGFWNKIKWLLMD